MTHYDILQVTQDASAEVIQMAYRALAKKYHPDLYNGDKEYATRKMQQINEAYRVLSSPILRNEYDQKIKNKTQEQRTQDNDSADTQSQRVNTPPYPPMSNKEKIVEGIKKFFSGCLKVLIFCLTNIKTTIGIILLIGFLLANLGVFDNEEKSSTVTNTKSTSSETETLPKVSEPISGTVLSGYEDNQGSELTITASRGSSCVVKLKTSSGTTRLSFYVRAGDTVTVGVPAEYLYVYFASGENWYGTKHLFGKNTSYSMDNKICDFTKYTWEYTLYPVTNGNFSQKIIDEEDFR